MLSQAGLQPGLQSICTKIYSFLVDHPGHDLHKFTVMYMELARTHCIMIEMLYSNPEEIMASQLIKATESVMNQAFEDCTERWLKSVRFGV